MAIRAKDYFAMSAAERQERARWRTGTFLMRRYSLTQAVDFLRATGFRLHAWGFVLALGKHSGIMVAWVTRTPSCGTPEETSDGE